MMNGKFYFTTTTKTTELLGSSFCTGKLTYLLLLTSSVRGGLSSESETSSKTTNGVEPSAVGAAAASPRKS